MKTILQISTSLLLFFILSIQPKIAYSSDFFIGDSTCCDTASITLISDSTTTDSCFGTALFYISPDTNCIIKRVITSNSDSLFWIDSISTYVGKYAIARGESKLIIGYFINNIGDTICSKTTIVQCPNCCDSNNIYYQRDTLVTENCSGVVYFKIDTLCDIKRVTTNIGPDSLLVWDSSQNAYKIPYTLYSGDSLLVIGYYLNNNGDTICIKSITINCLTLSCCDQIQFRDSAIPSSEGAPCCGTLTIDLGDCEYGFIAFYDLSNPMQYFTQVTHNTFDYCINPGEQLVVEFAFFDMNGNLVCNKSFEKYCHNFLRKNGGLNENKLGIKIIPNPITDEFKIVTDNITILKNSKLSIYNTSGLCVKKQDLSETNKSSSIVVNVSDLNQGIYIVEIQNSESTMRSKISIIK